MAEHRAEPLVRYLPLGERRTSLERRGASRRRQGGAVPVDRRRRSDRRGPVSRRETAGGHVRHAIQLLEDLLHAPETTSEVANHVTAAARHLWLSLRELRVGNGGA